MVGHPMYLATLNKHLHVNSKYLMLTAYENHYLVQPLSIICASLPKSIISHLVALMTNDNLHTNIIAHDRNLNIMISFMLCYVTRTSLNRLKINVNS